ncbi:fumarylacetoacetate hydrolase family protein [Methylobacterium sp. E-046]|uniref:fumarylacetoacetate hydrolase family protein n=1 Tax=Methylobacterium sp. E-046 TaxID=2836576 RepID=UPI001FBBEB66|nr:fumarylacetoacetate hydrolase family protein [Methylobacterium sp. E-046]MCJ2103515.1 fumarylacetoacetate hydrolase family protein [Methylobacterium sp. E-046]
MTGSDVDRHPDLVQTLIDCPPQRGAGASSLLPFQPRSYRDFMLYERHYIQAAYGYLRRFRPVVSGIARGFKTVTGRDLPPLRPASLWYHKPIYYMGNHLAFVADGAEIVWPSYTDALDYELELGFFLCRPLLNATPEEAMTAIGGFAVFNDFSARDVQAPEMRSGFGPQKSKHFCNAISSIVVSADEVIDRFDNLRGRVILNEQTVAECASAGARFSLGESLAHVSREERLYAGEFFGTGTWPNGSGLENGHWLKPGDTIRIEIDGVGSLTNKVVQRDR